MIDIGGPSLLRAASKNYKYITPIIDIKDYKKLINNLKKIMVKLILFLEKNGL